MRLAIFLLLTVGLARCVDHNILECESPNPLLFKDSTEFKIPFHCTISNGANHSIRFASVNADSRCPVDARCIWAGEIDVSVEIFEGENIIQSVRLTFQEPKKEIELDSKNFEIMLIKVSPSRKTNDEIRKTEYQLLLAVNPIPG